MMNKIIMAILLTLSFHTFAAGENSLKDVQFKDLNNNTVTLEQYVKPGSNLYVKMWASWCPMCLAGLDDINQLSAEPNKKFQVVTIVSPNYKGEKSTRDFIDWYSGLDYKNIVVLLDENAEVAKRANLRGYPSSLLLDANLTLLKVIPGHLDNQQIKLLAEH